MDPLTAVVSPIIKLLASSAYQLILNAKNAKKGLKELHLDLTLILSVLENPEALRKINGALPVSLWLRELEDVAYEAMELLDEHAHEIDHQKKVSIFNKFGDLFLGSEIKKIKKSLDRVGKNVGYVTLLNQDQSSAIASHHSQTQSSLDNVQVSERVNDVQTILQSLAVLKGEHRLSGICIVGMPGIGKTAVARSIFEIEDARVELERGYDLVARVSLAEGFSDSVILKEMLQFLDSRTGALTSLGAIESHLKKKLQKKNLLVILDDVYDVDAKKWDDFMIRLRRILLTGVGNSSIVVTTSNKLVASVMEKNKKVNMLRHELKRLSVQECWRIMERTVCEEIGTITPVLTGIGHEIANQCGGLPLVASTIGRYLREHAREKVWLSVKNNKTWDSSLRMSILSELKRTTYDRLPSHLKKCFAFCSIFPRGTTIRRDDLVQLWLAKRFLEGPVVGDEDVVGDKSKILQPEDVGNSYFRHLVSNYLFEVVETDEFDDPKSCQMHDEVHNLALLVSDHETYICSNNNPIENIPVSDVRHVRVVSGTNLKVIPEKAFTRLYSLFLEVDAADFNSKVEDLKHLRSLKVVSTRKPNEFLDTLKKSRHVKYLDMSGSGIEVESAVTNFHCLQTLRCMGCKSLTKLSSNVLEKLDSLRHIYCDENDMPSSIEKLTSLQRLPLFVVGTRGEGRNIKELKCLNQLRGLKICNLEQVDLFEATGAQLQEKANLLSLHLVWSHKRTSNHDDEGLLRRLQPTSNLKSLTLENYRGQRFPLWMEKMNLTSLVRLELIHCENIPNVGPFPELKVLSIRTMPKVKDAGNKFDGGQPIELFPALRKLKLYDMENLEERIEDMAVSPCLKELHIKNCPVLQTWQMNGSTSLELSKVSIKSCQNLQALPNMLKINSLEIKSCPNLSRFDETQMDEIIIDGQVVKPQP